MRLYFPAAIEFDLVISPVLIQDACNANLLSDKRLQALSGKAVRVITEKHD